MLSSRAFENAVIALLPHLYGAALRMAKNTADAEDLVAAAVSKAWEQRAKLRDPARFRGWMFRILTNTFFTECRRRAPTGNVESLDAMESEDESFSLFERLHQPILMWWGNPEQQFLARLLEQDLERAIDALPAAYRIVVLLVDVEGLSYQEVAETLEVPIGTVRSRLARGRAQLQKALWLHAQDDGYAKPEPAMVRPT
ncbi:MAG: sigma-70 family RNA polymerase sigma factor [Gemmatimonadota bacterium]